MKCASSSANGRRDRATAEAQRDSRNTALAPCRAGDSAKSAHASFPYQAVLVPATLFLCPVTLSRVRRQPNAVEGPRASIVKHEPVAISRYGLLFPNTQQSSQRHQLPQVIRIVVGHQQRLAQNGLAIAPGKARI